MDCNKDEALRAKEIAERKMQSGDFVTARKIAQKAKQLYPELDSISQLLTVCDVHCSMQNKVNGMEVDWYRVLQVQQFSGQEVVKKQFRKLALLLHPDKNQFAGAEAAFKLIVDANTVLSEPYRRSAYDAKLRSSVRSFAPRPPPHHQPGRNSHAFKSAFYPQYMNPPCQQSKLPMFWTSCCSCKIRYQFYSEFQNQKFLCPSCRHRFVAVDLSNEDVPPEVARSQFFSQLNTKFEPQSNGGNPSHTFSGSNGIFKAPKPKNAGNIGVGCKQESKASKGVNVEAGKVASTLNAGLVKPEKPKTSNSRRKREIESLGGSNNSFTTGSIGVSAYGNSDHQMRRSSRKKHITSYKEHDNDDDFACPTSKGEGWNGFSDATIDEKATDVGISNADESAKAVAATDLPWGTNEVKQNESLDSDDSMGSKVFEFPQAEFSNFDKNKTEGHFSVDQIWAVYDPIDGMPRIYVKIKKVYASRFKLAWLEASPEDGNGQWHKKELPIACGNFEFGKTQETDNLSMFSHQMICVEERGKGLYIHPKKGEIWAIFEDWNLNWCSEPEKHKPPYKYEFVEIVSDFFEDIGIGVAYLERVEGFVSIFRLGVCNGVISFCVRPSEMYWFSHQVPAFKMTGNEAPGIPAGCFELDPASLPSDCFSNFSQTIKKEKRPTGQVSCSPKVKPCNSSNNISTLKKHEDGHKSMNDTFKDDNESNSSQFKDDTESDSGQCMKGGNSSKGVSASCPSNEITEILKKRKKTEPLLCDLKPRRSTRMKSINQSARGNDNKKHEVDKKGERFDQPIDSANHPEDSSSTDLAKRPMSSLCKVIEVHSYDFKRDKSEDKLKPGQIWAAYSAEDGLPRTYVQVKKIESSTTDLRLHVVMLESCSTPGDTNSRICCGHFRVESFTMKVLSPAKLSHRLEAELVGKDTYAVYPRKTQIWAVHKNWNPKSKCTGSAGCECDFVEVVKNTNQGVTVVALIQLKEYDTFYRAVVNKSKKIGVTHIKRAEFGRFSHQCAAFKHTGEGENHLKGLWELEAASIPGRVKVIVLD